MTFDEKTTSRMTVAVFSEQMRKMVNAFERHWVEHQEAGAGYPDSLPVADWFDQFQAWMELQTSETP